GPKAVTILGPEETTGLLHASAQLRLAAFKLKSSTGRIYNMSSSLRHVYPDRPQYLLCLTSPFYDRATVKWYGLLNITGQWQELMVLDTFTRQLEDDHINYVLGSIVQLVSTNTDHAPLQWISVKCAAFNDGYNISDGRTSNPVSLNVAYTATDINMTASDESGRPLYPRATNPQLLKTTLDQSVTLDTQQNPPAITADSGLRISITCQVDMSNPKPRIHWRLHQCPTQLEQHWNGNKSQIPGESDGKKCKQIALKGGSVELDLQPLANPPIENLVWLRNDKLLNPRPLERATLDESRQLSVHRISVHSSTLRIQPVEIEDMGNYSLVASNNMGFTRFQFFLNVTCKLVYRLISYAVLKTRESNKVRLAITSLIRMVKSNGNVIFVKNSYQMLRF
ncbi:hypothetical protein AHF37_11278, partial [Paragonimus kellicotti]